MAYLFGQEALQAYSSAFSRKDFTLPQLFACLALKVFLKTSFRGVEAFLRDCPEWLKDIGLPRAPDHATVHRAFKLLTRANSLSALMDKMIDCAQQHKMLGKTVAIDSTLLDVHYRSRHYEQRCRHHANDAKRSGNSRRSRSAKRTPKLAVVVDTHSHLVLSTRPRTGMGSDARDFLPALRQAHKRHPRIRNALADAGYDSHENHRVCREEMKIRSLIKTGIGRPTDKAPSSKYRRKMQRELSGSQKGKLYGQRAQAETFNSMFKRNFGDALRARTTIRRRWELNLRVAVHNIAIIL